LALAVGTQAGAATFSRFLTARTQEINRVVTETVTESQAGAATLGSLGPSYQAVEYGPKPQEPPPAPVPFPPYQPKVWGACRPGEYVFVLNYLGHVRAIVGNCVIQIMPMGTGIDLSKLADVALDIGRSVGCCAYRNDFTLPEFPEEWRNQPVGWSTNGFPPYIPGPPGPKD
jgi:hypothetical protein